MSERWSSFQITVVCLLTACATLLFGIWAWLRAIAQHCGVTP